MGKRWKLKKNATYLEKSNACSYLGRYLFCTLLGHLVWVIDDMTEGHI